MRSTGLPFSFLLGLVLPMLGLSSCSNDTTPVIYASVAYQIRCLDCQPAAPDEAGRIINVVNGEDGYKLACKVERSDGVRRVTFSIEHLDPKQSSTDHILKISSGNLDAAESEHICDVRIVEGANTYTASCSSDEPDPAGGAPCQVTFEEKNGVIKGGLYCTAIPNAANLTTTRYVVAPNTRTSPANFELHGCGGL